MRMAKIVPRGFTTCADAYLTPCLQRYIRSFSQGFANDLKSSQVGSARKRMPSVAFCHAYTCIPTLAFQFHAISVAILMTQYNAACFVFVFVFLVFCFPFPTL